MNHWEVIKQNAYKAQQNNTVWTSFVEKKEYQVKQVEDRRIIVLRKSGGKPASVTEGETTDAITKLLEKGRLPKAGRIYVCYLIKTF